MLRMGGFGENVEDENHGLVNILAPELFFLILANLYIKCD